MYKIAIIGSGNVGTHLINAFLKCSTIEILQVYNRSAKALELLPKTIPTTSDIQKITSFADVYFLCVTDTVISKLSKALPFTKKLVVHTSGSVAMEVLDAKNNKGVWYPLQSFSKEKEVDFTKIPIAIEAQNPKDTPLLHAIASTLSNKIFYVDSTQRKALHVAAVFANNFTNHVLHMAHQICQENAIDFSILHPLIQETAEKACSLPPYKAQTGPAKRHNTEILQEHIAYLNNDTEKQEIYKTLTQSILKHHDSTREEL